MSKLADVIEKIQKLLNVASRSDKPGEVEAAQLLAQNLITKYQIEDAELYGKNMDGNIASMRVATPDPYAIDKATLLNSIAIPNFCKVLRGDDYCMIYGHINDIKLCIAMYEILNVHMANEMTAKLKKLKKNEKFHTKSWIKSFFSGYSLGISERIKQAKKQTIDEMESTGTSLAIVLRDKQHAIEEYWQQLTRGASSKRKITSISGFKAGKESAANADIYKNPKIKE